MPIYEDIRELHWHDCDVICGGFPCQDISNAGHKVGVGGERSGLWSEYARLIRDIRPRYVIVENVAALLGRGLGEVLADLASIGYDAEWDCISAADIGSPQLRNRLWLLAYPQGERRGPVHQELGLLQAAREHCARLAGDSGSADPAYGAGVLWPAESGLVRVADGIPDRVDRLRALGNAVVPQIPEMIGRAIMEAECTSNQASG